MPYKPPALEQNRPSNATLTTQMVAIGMQFSGPSAEDVDIEPTLVFASELAMCDGDLRVLSVLTMWLTQHSTYLNVDRLIRLCKPHASLRVRVLWSAVAKWLHKDRRFRRLESIYEGPRHNLLPIGSDFQIQRHGEDERFSETVLRVPANSLRTRHSDVLCSAELISKHEGYRNRVIMGPTWRADVWTKLQNNSDLCPADVARLVGCAFGTAWHVKRDFELVRKETLGLHDAA